MLSTLMRWIASLVVVCLMAATGVRPIRGGSERRDPHAAALLDAQPHGLAASATTRRAHPGVPDARLQAFVVATAFTFVPPARVALLAPGSEPSRPVLTPRLSRSSRGPPVG